MIPAAQEMLRYGHSCPAREALLQQLTALVPAGPVGGLIPRMRIPTKSPRRTDMKSPVDSETMSPTFPI